MDGFALDGVTTYLAISDRERAAGGSARRRAAQAVWLAGAFRRATILDVGAGQGWHALELAPRHTMLAIDPSEPLVRVAEQRADALDEAIRPEFAVTDTQHLPLEDGSVDVALSLGTTIGYDDVDRDRAALAELRRVIGTAGRLILEAVSAPRAERRSPRERRFADGASVTYEPSFDGSTQVLSDVQRLVAPGGRRGEFRYRVHAYDPSELLALAREAGFGRLRLHGDLDGSPLTDDSAMVLEATPRAPILSVFLGR